ncbi:hypothetical protein POM88_047259 [Heracleum sosnowskyi]|uniref:Uncharacterized protein n=1 Tax=Heracleum sosnowskyi TaxID=360622 RepID=A0AAD8LZA4_9APIA|nr:hypothetical protein POM88_047259 [Heracleum sosnowskyi]
MKHVDDWTAQNPHLVDNCALGPREGAFYNVTNPMMVQHYGERNFGSSRIGEAPSTFPSGQLPHNGGISHRSTPFTKSFSPSRYQMEGEYDPRKLMTVADIGDHGSSLKQLLQISLV